MYDKLLKAYENLTDDGKGFKNPNLVDISQAEHIQVEGFNFLVSISCIPELGSHGFESIKIPETHLKLPIVSVVSPVNVHSIQEVLRNPEAIKALKSKEWLTIFQDKSLMGFCFYGGEVSHGSEFYGPMSFLDAIDKSTVASKSGSQYGVSGANLSGGMWFNDSGVYFMVPESQYGRSELAPINALSKFVNAILPYYPKVKEWVYENNGEGEDPTMWWKKLAVIMIRQGWHLAWKGVVHTDHYHTAALADDLAKVKQGWVKLKWSGDAVVDIVNVDDRSNEQQVMWSMLIKSQEVNQGRVLRSIVIRTVEMIERQFGKKLRV